MDSTLIKGLRVLETLARSSEPRGVTELSRELELTKSNVHRTLQALQSAGFIQSDGEGRYSCTLKLFELGSLVVDRIDMRGQAEPVMIELSEKSRETVHLAILDELDVIYLHKIESPEPVRAYSRVGGRAPAHCVASGKALLAFQSTEWLGRLPDPLPGYTPASHVEANVVREELAQVKRDGYALNRGEWREQVGGVAAPVFDARGLPVGAIGVSGPLTRVEPGLTQHITHVIDAARKISVALGCRNYEQLVSK